MTTRTKSKRASRTEERTPEIVFVIEVMDEHEAVVTMQLANGTPIHQLRVTPGGIQESRMLKCVQTPERVEEGARLVTRLLTDIVGSMGCTYEGEADHA